MSRTAQFAVNALANYARMLVAIATVAILTPYIIGKIGKDDFGLWTLTISALGFFSLLDLGFGTGVVKYAAEHKGTGNLELRNRMLSTLAAVYIGITVIAALGTAILAIFFNRIFALPPDQKSIVLLWILSVRFVLLALPLSLFRNALYGEQKIYLVNILQIVGTLLNAGGSWFALQRGMGLIGLAWVNLAAMVVEYLGYVWFAYAAMDHLRISPALFDKTLLREALSFSSASFLVNVAALVLLRTDPILVKMFLPLGAVALYGVALKIAENAYLLTKQFTNLLAPLVAQLKGGGEELKIRFVFVNCTKFALAPSVVLAVATYVLGREMIVFWIGPEFADAGVVLMVLMTAMALSMSELTASAVLSMTGYHRLTAQAAVIEIVVNIGFSILFALKFGMIGVAMGTLASTLLVDLAITVRRACELHHVTYWSYFERALAPALLPALAQFAVTLALKTWHPPHGLIDTALLAVPGAMLYFALFWLFGVQRSEKDLLTRKLFHRHQVTHSGA